MGVIDNLKWRYATKKFDTSKKISPSDLETIKEAVQLSASSYGLQLYKVLIIEDAKLREKLKVVSWGQSQITDASYLVVFCNYSKVNDNLIDEFLSNKANTQNLNLDEIKGYGDFMKNNLSKKGADEIANWTAKQTYLALSNLLMACAELKIDACPMEGFEPEKYNEILDLYEKGLNASLIATIGYRSDEDKTQHEKKVRKPLNKLFEKI